MSDYSQWEEVGYWYDEGESGPPTMEDWEWYVAHVMVVQDRPPAVNRQPAPMDGQVPLFTALNQSSGDWNYTPPDTDGDLDDILINDWRGKHHTGQD